MASKKTASNTRSTRKSVNRKKYKTASSSSRRKVAKDNYALTVLLSAVVAVVFAIFIYFNAAGVVSDAVRTLLFGLFARVTYLIPLIVAALSVYAAKRKSTRRFWIKSALCFSCAILVGTLIQLISPSGMPKISELWSLAQAGKGGGLFSGMFAVFLNSMIGKAASIVIVIVGMFVMFSVIFKISFVSLIQSFFAGVKNEIEDIERVDVSEQGRKVKRGMKNKKSAETEVAEEVILPAQLFEQLEIEDKPKKKEKHTYADDIKPEERGGKSVEQFDAEQFLKDVAAQLPQTEGVQAILKEQSKSAPKGDKQPERAETTTKEEREQIGKELNTKIAEKHEYVYPPLSLLNKAQATSGDKRREMLETSKKLMETLKSFGVDAKLLQVTNGPAVTRYEIQLNAGVKISKITGLAEDLALNLAVPTVLVAPVPGKAAVGIEVPNNSVGLVSARELLESSEFKSSKSKLTIALGKEIGVE